MEKYLDITSIIPRKVEHYILLSVLLFAIGTFLYHNIATTIGQSLYLLSFIIFVFLLVFKRKHLPFRGMPLFLFSLLLIDILWITIYTFLFSEFNILGKNSYNRLMEIYGSNFFFPSIMPFMLLLFHRGGKIDIRYFIRLMTLLSIIYLCLYPFAFMHMLDFKYDMTAEWGEKGGYGDFINNSALHISAFSVPVVLYYFRRYIPNRLWWMFFAVSIGELLIGLYTARRGRTVTFLLYYVLCYSLYFLNKRSSKIWLVVIGVIVLGLGYLVVIDSSSGFLSLMFQRGMEDSRTNVELAFYASMDEHSWIWGRGWFGQYFDYFHGEFRSGIETGYLALILRGGVVYLVVYVAILLYSGIRGLFYSRSIFVKSFAIMILMSIFELYPWGWPQFNFKFFIIWIGVYICNTPKYLKLSDRRVKKLVFGNYRFICRKQ